MIDFMFSHGGGTPLFFILQGGGTLDDVVYQENRLCLIILGHMCSWKILKLSDFMFSQGGGIPQFVILKGGGTRG